MSEVFTVDGTDYTVEPCTAICCAELGDESKRQDSLLVTSELNGEKSMYVVFGWVMPESCDRFCEMCDLDPGAWESDQAVIASVRPPKPAPEKSKSCLKNTEL